MKRVLIVYHSFDEWEMGPIRLRRIARQLPAAGWQPVVLTSDISARTAAEVPESIECLRAGGLDLADLYGRIKRFGRAPQPVTSDAPGKLPANRSNRITGFINRWFLAPDKQITWKRAAIQRARVYLREHPVDAIFASLAPRTNLLVAAALAREFDLPCVMEFRDLWTGSPYHHIAQPTALHRLIHRRMERNAIRAATRVTAVSRGIAAYLEQTYRRELKAPVALNHNFFDPAEYPDVQRPAPPRPMIISYIGAMYANRSPVAFFDGLKVFIDRNRLTPSDVNFRWTGSVISVPGVDEAIRAHGLEPFIIRLGQLRHEEALREVCRSDVSLLVQAPGDTLHIPGKLFEAMGARVPLLALADVDEVRDLIEEAEAGVFSPRTPEGIADSLDRFWTLHQQNAPWRFNEPARRRHQADHAAARLAHVFNEAVSDHARTL